ncbi:SDR family oxidoreductase [Snodgrassella sp. B3882]|uniref:SDR family oxidoreductase n=1 Tax=Snodgrassella sp. B3882 TaxID=2818037 RepID=UPI002B40C3F6|nr:SDR family oxidoreductase [Snodgrassella sp. B3882]MCX8745217.1 SDR family oxidoreductase [Snodgrassella sp. B3882]
MTILVTGASAGFGASISRTLVKAGYQVIGAARRQDKLQHLSQELGAAFLPLEMDVTDTNSVDQALASIPEQWAQIDLLVNNAGLALGMEVAQEANFADWERMIHTNVLGLTYVTRKILPQMVQNNKGYIINLGSTAGSWPYKGGNVYGATKAFVRQFSLNLRTDLVGTRIRVTNVAPGLCGDTEFSNVRFRGDEDRVQAVYENISYLKPEDIANTILWLYQTPAHVNVNHIEIMPVSQTFAGLSVTRDLA